MPTTFYNRGSSTDTFVIDVGAKVDPKTQNSMSINGYRFELIPKHKFEKQKSWNGSWVKEFAIADGATYLLTPVSENTTYMIRVASKNSAGYSDYTETLYETTIPKYPMIFPSNCSPFLSPMITLIMLVLYLLV